MNKKMKTIPAVMAAIAISILCAAPQAIAATTVTVSPAAAQDTSGSTGLFKKKPAAEGGAAGQSSAVTPGATAPAAQNKHAPMIPDQAKERHDQMMTRFKNLHAAQGGPGQAAASKNPQPTPEQTKARHEQMMAKIKALRAAQGGAGKGTLTADEKKARRAQMLEKIRPHRQKTDATATP